MKHILSLSLILCSCLSAGSLCAQEIILWRVENLSTPTLVPAYAGQPSPFPYLKPQEEPQPEVDPLVEAAMQARLAALEKAEKLLSSKEAFQPELAMIHISGRVDGPAGPKVLVSNQWVGVGQRMNVRLSRSATALKTIQELREYDVSAADEIAARLQQNLDKNPYLQMVMKKIGTKEIQLESVYGQHTVAITRAPEQ